MNTPKWIPKHSADILEVFSDARQLECDLRVLGKKFATNVNINLPDYYEFGQLLSQSRDRFERSERLQARLTQLAAISPDQRIERSPYKVLQSRRATLCRQNLGRRHCQLIFVVQKMIRQMLGCGAAAGHSDASIDAALVLCTLHNGSVLASAQQATEGRRRTLSGAQVCSNSFPGLMLAPRKFDLNTVLQTISRHRSELCCLALIACLVAAQCAPEIGAAAGNSADDSSDTSSVEILKALTVHLASPASQQLTTTAAAGGKVAVDATTTPAAAVGRPKSGGLTRSNTMMSGKHQQAAIGSSTTAAAAAGPANVKQMLHSPSTAAFNKPGVFVNDASENDPAIDFFDKLVAERPPLKNGPTDIQANGKTATTSPSSATAGSSSAPRFAASTTTPLPSSSAADAAAGAVPANTELLDQLVANEENYVANILLRCLKLCPSAFDGPPTKADIVRWVNRGTRALWTQVGITLEHVVIWWSHAPLACRPVSSTRHLRDWLLQLQPADAPEPVLSTLRGLGETLTVYVTGSTWDAQFRLALVAGALPVHHATGPASSSSSASFSVGYSSGAIGSLIGFGGAQTEFNGTTTGRLWGELLHGLTAICNSCDGKGTIPSELPIVEQIPVLHRLDHSVHTMRLWALAQAKALCTDWNVNTFIRVAYTDINHCLKQLAALRCPDLVPCEPTEVLVQVCVALRAKLVSEIKVNIAKLTQAYGECIDVMASICRTTSLATLSLCFPAAADWQGDELQEVASDYVRYYLNQLYLPVVRATQLLDILKLTLQIMCEAWLDHIYAKRIKFSRAGAMNLMRDFDGVAAWIEGTPDVLPAHRPVLGRHEVLRMCEGVAKILLRKPDDVISMLMVPDRGQPPQQQHYQQQQPPHHQQQRKAESGAEFAAHRTTTDEAAQLPPEMFVPNQQQWLELRARNRNLLGCLICSCVTATTANDK